MNLVALPETEVSIVQLACTILARADIFHDFDQVRIIDVDMSTVSGDNVLWLNPAIMVLVER